MIDFACKQFDINDIIKCGLGLTKAEFRVMQFFIKNIDEDFMSAELSKKTGLNLTTIQKAVKKLSEKKIILRHQRNLDNGGYVFTYECNSKKEIREIIKKIIRNWSDKVEENIDKW